MWYRRRDMMSSAGRGREDPGLWEYTILQSGIVARACLDVAARAVAPHQPITTGTADVQAVARKDYARRGLSSGGAGNYTCIRGYSGLRRRGLTLTQKMFSGKVGKGPPLADERRNGNG